ncbi:MAG: bifunctional adenosylcobinamide kinase/adenosylcobinamide-phosphate guanylyltransferase [Pseudobutyrivibrio sp.]|nr:bifunctional adenosylcobinamide kinase/adenosylcobinamide-phosphate guanylyltransferase [Pseudobutyrivibrio sp.]
MILIVGGSYQGKTKFARDNFGQANYLNQFHLFVKKRMEEGMTEEEILGQIFEMCSEGKWVIIADEIGSGVVPANAWDRQLREWTGRILIEIAREAEEVYRVVCGIGRRIK